MRHTDPLSEHPSTLNFFFWKDASIIDISTPLGKINFEFMSAASENTGNNTVNKIAINIFFMSDSQQVVPIVNLICITGLSYNTQHVIVTIPYLIANVSGQDNASF